MAMSKQSREKTALVVFVCLILLSLGGFIAYLVAGHSWNVAASNLDDTFGSMEGYTAIVYEGIESSDTARSTSTSSSSRLKKAPVSLAKVEDSYQEKGAVVFTLDTTDLERYSEGTILKKGEHRFGVFSVTKVTPKRVLEQQVAYFTEHQVDFIVVMTSNKAFVEDVSGIDIVLSTQDEELFVMGETKDGTFFVDVPERGLVGAILISPSNVVSAKVIDSI